MVGKRGRWRRRVTALRRSRTFFAVTIAENGGKDCAHMLNRYTQDVIKGIGRPVASEMRPSENGIAFYGRMDKQRGFLSLSFSHFNYLDSRFYSDVRESADQVGFNQFH